jgi:DNA-binding LacI/PurR family transcriptional regulator
MRTDHHASEQAPQRVTIREVAQVAGVSVATVSLALADNPNVAAKTKERVRAAADRLNYRPSAVGRALQSQRSNAIGLVIPHSGQHVFSHLYFMEMLAGVSEVLTGAQMTLVLSVAPTDTDGESAYLNVLRSQQVDGIILASAALHDQNVRTLQRSGYPFVFIGRYPLDPTLPAVGIDDRGGAQAAVAHLVRCGHTRIAHISGPLQHLSALDRRDGYYLALEAAGVAPDPALLVEGDYGEAAGREAMRALLALPSPPTALFAANDETAVGAIETLRETGIEPGVAFPVVGFDDVVLARMMSPPLTTVHQPMRQLGVEAAQRLIRLLGGEPLAETQLELPTTLIVRRSCGCAS